MSAKIPHKANDIVPEVWEVRIRSRGTVSGSPRLRGRSSRYHRFKLDNVFKEKLWKTRVQFVPYT